MGYPSLPPVVKTATGLVYSGKCMLHGFLIGTDGVNDPTITVYNNTEESGDEAIPTCTYDASQLNLNGATGLKVYCDKGLYISISCSGAVEVVLFYAPLR